MMAFERGEKLMKEIAYMRECFERELSDGAGCEGSGLSPDEVQELAKAKADGRLVVLKASISQDVWFYDGANRLMQGKVLEYLNCGNGLIYQVQGVKKGLWLHEHEIFLSQKEALLAVAKKRKRRWKAKQRGGKRDE